ncbi:hypothetical protein EI94DRAFT_220697 [Lactarius quietus]|nr:hypothetical protein EI94DRAFT_220697 [Lactarius quietus]
MIWSTKPILNSIVEQSNRLPKGVDDFSGPPNSEVLLGQLLPKGEELEVDEDEDVPNENVDFDSSEVAGTGLVFEGADGKPKGEEEGTLSAHLPSQCLVSTASNSKNFARHDKSVKRRRFCNLKKAQKSCCRKRVCEQKNEHCLSLHTLLAKFVQSVPCLAVHGFGVLIT